MDSNEERAEEYRDKYFEEKFDGVHKVLNSILYQTKKTNGNVTQLQKRMYAVERIQQTCPVERVSDEINEVRKETEVIRFFSKHPNWGRALTATFLISIVINIGLILFQVIKYLGG